MRSLLLISVATAALAVGIVAADAQQGPPDRRDPPAATDQSQPPQRARDRGRQEQPGARSQREPERQQPARATTGQGQGSDRQAEQPRSQPPQPQQSRQERGREPPARSTTGQANERQADQPRTQPQRGDARDQTPAARERTGADRNRGQSRERSTTGPSQQDRAGTSGSRPSEMTRDAPRSGDAPRQDTAREPASRAAERDRGGASGSLRLTEQERSRVSASFSTRIDRMNVRPLSRSQVAVSIGATLPRSVHLHAVPRGIIVAYPQFRNHRFVVVEDEIVIVEPRSQRVVSVLPMSGERRTVRSGSRDVARSTTRETTGSGVRESTGASTRETIGAAPASRINITPRVREEIRTVVLQQPSCRLEQRIDFLLFIPLPRTVEVCELPPQIVSEAPELRRYRYVVRGDEVALVDPDEYKVVEVIR